MTDLSKLRIADADRERAIEELREHAGEGRLTPEELEERVGRAYGATTRADLDVLRDDLPVSAATAKAEVSRRRAKLARRLRGEASVAAVVSLACVAIWLTTAAGAYFWPGWVIAVLALPIARDSVRLLGPGPDLDLVQARLQARHERRLARAERRRRRYRGGTL